MRFLAALSLIASSLLAGRIAIGDDSATTSKIDERPIADNERQHWSFLPLRRPELPAVQDATWPSNAVDYFILARLDGEDLMPLPPADRVTLIRRVTFDLTGLPPTPDEVETFVNNNSPDAYQQVVDRLLASHHYGERWAQHWLDLARFAETDGFEHDIVRLDAWRFRDWVINALNDDMPYDRFLQLQLAGDELLPGDKQASIATKFCLAGPDMPDINSMDERKHNLLNEMTATVGSAIFGLQLGCAQCHDHKYDPVSQADFYRLRAVFEPALQLQKNKSVEVLQERSGTPPASYLMIRGNWQRRGPPVAPAFPRIANPTGNKLAPVAGKKSSGRRTALARWLTRPDHILTSRVIVNRIWQHHFGQGLCRSPSDFGVMGEPPTHPKLLDWLATELVRQNWSIKQLHRLIVTSSTYRQASRSTMLGWTASQRDAAKQSWQRSAELDAGNKWLARFPRRRMEGEVLRDAMLAAAGVLNTSRGGPGVRPPLPMELLVTLLRNQWEVSPHKSDHYRRSIYIFARRNLRYPIFDAFDRPDANASCPKRSQSTTAPQSLLLLNSELSLDIARRIAGRIQSDTGNSADQKIHRAFRLLLSRPPTPDELAMSQEFLKHQSGLAAGDGAANDQLALPIPFDRQAPREKAAALVDLCLALLNLNEFLYID